MDLLNIKLEQYIPYAIEALTYAYGEQYRSIITDRLNNTVFLYYYNDRRLDEYVKIKRQYEKTKSAIQFLKAIGVDTKKYEGINYSSAKMMKDVLTREDIETIGSLIGNPECFAANNNPGLRRFIDPVDHDCFEKESKTRVINYFLRKSSRRISEEDLEAFCKTEEFKEILKLIKEYYSIYVEISDDYHKRNKNIANVEDFIISERKRRIAIRQQIEIDFCQRILKYFPPEARDILSKKTPQSLESLLLISSLEEKTIVEFFSKDNLEKRLETDNVIWGDLENQIIDYLELFGIDVYKYLTTGSVKEWLEIMEKEEIKKYLPTETDIRKIKEARIKACEDIKDTIIYERSDFAAIKDKLNSNRLKPMISDFIFRSMKEKHICIPACGAYDYDENFKSVMLYSLREFGESFHNFLHEAGHVVTNNENGCGIETSDALMTHNRNKKKSRNRRYELFDEIINEKFVRDGLMHLYSLDIFPMEKEEITNKNFDDYDNTLYNEALKQLVDKHKDAVKNSMIYVTRDYIINEIGKDNFERLVDALNYLDYLYMEKRDGNDNIFVLHYQETLDEIKQIYSDIDVYATAHTRAVMA